MTLGKNPHWESIASRNRRWTGRSGHLREAQFVRANPFILSEHARRSSTSWYGFV